MVAITLHLYYQDLWDEFKKKIVPLLNETTHLYITVNEETKYTNDMRKIAKEVYVVKNKGTDFGPFVYIWKKIRKNGYKYVLKLHGKKSTHIKNNTKRDYGTIWRMELVNSIISDHDKFQSVLSFMDEHENIFMAGSQLHFHDENKESIDHPNRLNCLDSINKLMQYVDSDYHGCFFGGSVFLTTSKYLNLFFSNFDLDELYDSFEDYHNSDGKLLAHAMERVIGYGVTKHSGKFLLLECYDEL